MLVNAWIALEDAGEATSEVSSELAELGTWLGVTRAKQSSTYAAVAAALGPHIWPQRYSRVEDAIALMSQGKHSATTKIRYVVLNRIVARLSVGDPQWCKPSRLSELVDH